MATINPYINFDGQCEQAFNFYQSVIGGEFQYVGRFKDMPDDPNCVVPEADKEKIMHISLPIGEHTILMGSDTSDAFGQNNKVGNNFSLSISVDSAEEADRIFKALGEGGAVDMPMNKTFWGSYFGMLTDQFGISWMVSHDEGVHL